VSERDPGPGSVLRAEREALGVTIREVSETLNLSMAVVEALEADDQSRLPGPVFARGYLRAYARLLELEPEPLLAQYPDSAAASAASTPTPAEPTLREWVRRRPGIVLGGATLLLATALALIVLWLMSNDVSESAAADEVGSAPAAADPGFSGGSGMGVDGAMPAVSGDRPFDPDASASNQSVAAADQGPAGQSDVVDPAGSSQALAEPGLEAPADDVGRQRLTALGDDLLAFRFSEDCWLEVRSASGVTLYSYLGRSGSALELVGAAPFRILLGYAPGAQLSFNGETVPLGPHTRNNVATLVLGQ